MQKNHYTFSFRSRMIHKGLIPVILMLLTGITVVTAETLNLEVAETPLNPAGSAYEVNLAPDGSLVVSDYGGEGEIRVYDADGSQAVIFSGVGTVSDARADANGTIWYVEQDRQCLGELNPTSGEVKCWELPIAPFVYKIFYGTTLDAAGRVWISENNYPILFRFDSIASKMCALDASGLTSKGGYYLMFDNSMGNLWFADPEPENYRLLSFNETDDQLSSYEGTDWDFGIEGIISDDQGGVWFTDSHNGSIGHLFRTDTEESLFRYPIPAGDSGLNLLTKENERIWYTAGSVSSGTIGLLDPALSSVTEVTFTKETQVDPPFICTDAVLKEEFTSSRTEISPDWTANEYATVTTPAGWSIFSMPAYFYPMGIQYAGNTIWIVDSGRQILGRHSFHQVFLPMLLR